MERDTSVNVWSGTKTMAAISILLLAERGKVDLHALLQNTGLSFPRTGKRMLK
jgi:CubicO group peptidase (beta-lactamase class C family)